MTERITELKELFEEIKQLLCESNYRKVMPRWKKFTALFDEELHTDECMIDKEIGALYSQVLQMYAHATKLPEKMYDWLDTEEAWQVGIRKDVGQATKGFCLRDKLVANILYNAGAGNKDTMWRLSEKEWANLRTMVALYMEEARYEEKVNRVILFLIQDIADMLDNGTGAERCRIGWLEAQTALVDLPYENVKTIIEDLYGYSTQRS